MSQNTRTISFCGEGGQFTLAVNPGEVSVTEESNHKTVDLLNVGTVAAAGNRGLIKTSIETFLPAKNSPFYKGKSPGSLLQLIKKWKNGKKPVRIIISGTGINTMFLVDSIKESYKEGQKDINISWSFIEYRKLNIPVVAMMNTQNTEGTGLQERSGGSPVPKSATVKKGDTLWGYAVKFYGNGQEWSRIAQANGISDPKKLQIGTVVTIPG